MTVADPDLSVSQATALHESVHGLVERQPHMSAAVTVTRGQRIALLSASAVVVAALVLWPRQTGVTLVALAMGLYLSNLTDRVMLFSRGVGNSPEIHISDEEARAIADDDLPLYTVFVPAFDEPEVVTRLIDSLGALDYPDDKLDIQLLLEADDDKTVSLAYEGLRSGVLRANIVLVPPAEPRTKPKA
ncbi:MAG TPA: hypothetical protein VHY77_10390, partial [Acidimicrobiales bacterium]|nr:hypothetical protein [Acidimicrobiales bacterium]